MINFTLRLDNDINIRLEQLSNYINVSKSSIINLSIAMYINKNIAVHNSKDEKTRVTLRISDEINKLLDEKIKSLSVSKNSLINSLVYTFINDFEDTVI